MLLSELLRVAAVLSVSVEWVECPRLRGKSAAVQSFLFSAIPQTASPCVPVFPLLMELSQSGHCHVSRVLPLFVAFCQLALLLPRGPLCVADRVRVWSFTASHTRSRNLSCSFRSVRSAQEIHASCPVMASSACSADAVAKRDTVHRRIGWYCHSSLNSSEQCNIVLVERDLTHWPFTYWMLIQRVPRGSGGLESRWS